MKVIGKTENDSYICIVAHREMEKFLNLYYGKLDVLKMGEEVDLGRGHDFASEAKAAMKQTADFVKANEKIIRAIIDGVQIFSPVEGSDD